MPVEVKEPRVETRTKTRISPEGRAVVLMITLLPRGSGNRAAVRRLAAAAAASAMAPHIKRVVCGSTRLTLYLRASLGLMAAVLEVTKNAEKNRDCERQMPLFSV
jgi:PHD/YefM family antitoxin component YafN of YafNO toxin-antitoxin module